MWIFTQYRINLGTFKQELSLAFYDPWYETIFFLFYNSCRHYIEIWKLFHASCIRKEDPLKGNQEHSFCKWVPWNHHHPFIFTFLLWTRSLTLRFESLGEIAVLYFSSKDVQEFIHLRINLVSVRCDTCSLVLTKFDPKILTS